MKEFKSAEQRMIWTYIDTFPPFVPKNGGAMPVGEQEEFYNFMRSVYQTIFDAPELLFSNFHDDGVYRYRYNRAHDKNPKLITAMQAALKKIDAFLEFLFVTGQQGAIPQTNKKYSEILNKCGVKDISLVWKEMSTRENASVLAFSKCMFDQSHNYYSDVFARLLGDETAYKTIEKFLIDNGYQGYYGTAKKFAIDYAKNYGKKDEPLKDSWAEREHAGISVFYDYYVARPAVLALRMPYHKELLSRFDSLDERLKKYLVTGNKKCDGCGYCTMGKAKSPNFFEVRFEENSYNLCPLFPGFYFGYVELEKEDADDIIHYLTVIDEFSNRH